MKGTIQLIYLTSIPAKNRHYDIRGHCLRPESCIDLVFLCTEKAAKAQQLTKSMRTSPNAKVIISLPPNILSLAFPFNSHFLGKFWTSAELVKRSVPYRIRQPLYLRTFTALRLICMLDKLMHINFYGNLIYNIMKALQTCLVQIYLRREENIVCL